MIDADVDIRVTDHALARWRTRGAEYADAPRWDLAAAVRAARPVPDDEALPPYVNREGGVRLYRRDDLDIYFVTTWPNPRVCVVVSVVRPGFGHGRRPHRTPPTCRKPDGPPPSLAYRPAQEVAAELYALDQLPRTKHLGREALEAEQARLTGRLDAVAGEVARLPRADPSKYWLKKLRKLLAARLDSVEARLDLNDRKEVEGVA